MTDVIILVLGTEGIQNGLPASGTRNQFLENYGMCWETGGIATYPLPFSH